MSSTKKGKQQKYQNREEFSLMYRPMLQEIKENTPKDHLCKHCYEKIDWKLKFGKYKKLSQPSKCNLCDRKTVVKAYRTICDKCCDDQKICSMCGEEKTIVPFTDEERDHLKTLKLDNLVENKMRIYKECSKNKLLRLLGKGKVALQDDIFIYLDSGEAVQNLRLKEKYKPDEDDGVDEDGEEEEAEGDSGSFASNDRDVE